ncbi:MULTISPECIES: nitrite reductase small subunit NirD [Vogesella]|uniref:Nitrite reductase n=1 Tax=Vogesella alkaliphila TaxID=1193621 RepID=A0ABQ2YPV4_9NEIS|nr:MULTISPECIES: nitrite reductase small subunit NirD [Vogesella]MDC7703956.1 nitrite reductase small subunit NirD [Vogesella indigofera]MDC7712225.1 nitrite reductase small subunit NirD [Vogesella indigofera]GGX88938.1 nitrite reductase [Vogesella alkaliphila]
MSRNWKTICQLNDIPAQGARVLKRDDGDDIAIFRTIDDQVFALVDKCPHKGGPLSQGIVSGRTVTCPLHNWNIDLATGEACAPDEGCSGHIPVKLEAGAIFLALD